MTNLNEFFKKHKKIIGEKGSWPNLALNPRIICLDGFSLSVQANRCAYSSPRNNVGPWDQVEVGFPSAEPELIMDYAESPDDPTGTVYSYVPIELVEQLIDLHGGIEED